ncbi:MAG: 50S ribosomal protein L21 [Clostridia bacterium]|nr:50S ribosomal protein L21 [Clostridia bacterium]
MYAIIETGGKQYRVEKDSVLYIEKLDAAEGNVTFDKVLAVNTGKTLKVGSPYVKGATVVAEIVKHGKGKKLNILTYKPKKGSSMRRIGHRQPYTKIQILEINATAKKPAATEAVAEGEATPKAAAKKTTSTAKKTTSTAKKTAAKAEDKAE